MATTHSKIRQALRLAGSRKWADVGALAEHLGKSKEKEFLVRGVPLGVPSLRRLVRLMLALEFLDEDKDGALRVTETGKAALPEDKFNRKTLSAIRSYFENNGLPFEGILKAVGSIELPAVPDADTVYDTVYSGTKEEDRKVSRDQFRTLMYLYALADGVDRRVRVFYGEK